MNIKNIIKEEVDDFDWADNIEPSQHDKLYFKRSNTLETNSFTTLFGNTVDVGDKFLPPNSSNIWVVVGMEHVYNQRGLGLRVWRVRLETEGGKKKQVWWENPIRHTQPNGTFPRRARPWQKMVKPITESDDLDWIRDVPTTILFSDVERGQRYYINTVNGGVIKDSYEKCGDWPDGLTETATAEDFEQYFKGQVVYVLGTLSGPKSISECFGDDIVDNVELNFDNDTSWWCNEDMLTLSPYYVD